MHITVYSLCERRYVCNDVSSLHIFRFQTDRGRRWFIEIISYTHIFLVLRYIKMYKNRCINKLSFVCAYGVLLKLYFPLFLLCCCFSLLVCYRLRWERVNRIMSLAGTINAVMLNACLLQRWKRSHSSHPSAFNVARERDRDTIGSIVAHIKSSYLISESWLPRNPYNYRA